MSASASTQFDQFVSPSQVAGHAQLASPFSAASAGSVDGLDGASAYARTGLFPVLAPPPTATPEEEALTDQVEQELADDAPVLMSCMFGCGPPQPKANGFTRGTFWHCRPCYNAERVLIKLSKEAQKEEDAQDDQDGQPQAKKQKKKTHLDELKERDLEAYNSIVRSCRVVASGKLSGLEERLRRQAAYGQLSWVEQTMTTCFKAGAVFVTRTKFCNHQKETHNMDEDQAGQLFDSFQVGQPGVLSLPGDAKRVAIMKDPELDIKLARTHGRRLGASSAIRDQGEANAVLGALANVGASQGQLSPEAFGAAAHLFRPGALTGSSSGQVLPTEGFFHKPLRCRVWRRPTPFRV